jgi:hypothetical protein
VIAEFPAILGDVQFNGVPCILLGDEISELGSHGVNL